MNVESDKNDVVPQGTDVQDADNVSAVPANAGDNSAPDLIAHDKRYHNGHWDGKTRCKYREDREKALGAAKTDAERNDIIDKLLPESVDGEDPEVVKRDEVDRSLLDGEDNGISSALSDMQAQLSAGGSYSGPNDGLTKLGDILRNASQEQKDGIALKILSMIGASFAPRAEKTLSEADKTRVSKLDKMISGSKNDVLKKVLGKQREEIIGKATPGSADKVDAVRSFAKAIGVDPSTVTGQEAPQGATDKAESMKAERSGLVSDMEMIKEKMQLASPDLAAALSASLDEIEKRIADIDKALNGGSVESADDAIERRKMRRELLRKEAEKIRSTRPKEALSPADAGVVPGKTTTLDSKKFAQAFSGLDAKDKIYAISDIHDAEYRKMGMSKFGTVLLAGDFANKGSTSHSGQRDMATAVKQGTQWMDEVFKPFCEKHPNQKFVVIAGNHDHFLGDPSADNIQWPSNVTYLKDSETNVNGLRVYGTPWCEKRKGGSKTASMESPWARQPFEIDDAAIKEKFDKIPEGLDVLVVHQPPKVDVGNPNDPMQKYGSQALTDAIKRAKPKLVICGHLHDADHRPFKIGDTVVMNASFVGDEGRKTQRYTHQDIGVVRDQGGVGFFVDREDSHTLGRKNGK